jgi:hypothetical protein
MAGRGIFVAGACCAMPQSSPHNLLFRLFAGKPNFELHTESAVFRINDATAQRMIVSV